MSLTLEWPGGSQSLATNSGWSAFGAWADTLDATAHRQVVHLWEHGYARDVAGFVKQLTAALNAKPPKDSTVRATATNLLQIAKAARGADHLAVSNGMGPADDDEDEWDEEAAEFDPKAPGRAESDSARPFLGRELSESFTGVDAHGHHWIDGKQVKAPEEPGGGDGDRQNSPLIHNVGMNRELNDEDLEVIREGSSSLKSISDFHAVESQIKEPTPDDLNQPTITLWHGTSKANAKRIIRTGSLKEGPRGMQASATIDHAAQYPEETGADAIVLLRADTEELGVDPNDQQGETVADGLFPKSGHGSSAELGSHEIIAVIDMRNGVRREEAFEALKRGDLLSAIYAGATVLYHNRNMEVVRQPRVLNGKVVSLGVVRPVSS